MARITPTLHPRSRFTSSLFATTLFASFFVVVLPHIVPCPAPRVAYTDDGSPPAPGKRRRRKVIVEAEPNPETQTKITSSSLDGQSPAKSPLQTSSMDMEGLEDGDGQTGKKRSQRECPIPKPGGLVGEILGFKKVSVGERADENGQAALSSTAGIKDFTRIAGNNGERPP